MSRRSIYILFTLIAFAGLGYATFWRVMASEIQKAVIELYANAGEDGVEISGPVTPVENFPFRPSLSFSGFIRTTDGTVVIPMLVIRGFPLPGLPVTLSFPQGLYQEDLEVSKLDELHATFTVPSLLPEMTYESVRAWSATGGKIEIRQFRGRKESLKFEGEGVLTVDSSLQPAGKIDLRATGYASFLQWLNENGFIGEKEARIATAVLTGLSTATTESGESAVEANLTLKNRTLSLGPLMIATLPTVVWPGGNQPAQLR